jgi:hypothetical protein
VCCTRGILNDFPGPGKIFFCGGRVLEKRRAFGLDGARAVV